MVGEPADVVGGGITAVAVKVLECEAMRNTSSGRIGVAEATSAWP
jgi:hypothetical protein